MLVRSLSNGGSEWDFQNDLAKEWSIGVTSTNCAGTSVPEAPDTNGRGLIEKHAAKDLVSIFPLCCL